MGETECINCPYTDNESRQGDLGNEEDTEEEDGEKGCYDWHQSVESYPVKQCSSNTS